MTTNRGTQCAEAIRAEVRDQCLVCDSRGERVYEHLRDRLFDAPGVWGLRRCANRQCGMLWLDPMPHPDELIRFYEAYYTHEKSGKVPRRRESWTRRLRRWMREGHLANRFGYGCETASWAKRLLGRVIWLQPLRRMEAEFSVMHLPAVPGGRMLDVGCGSGNQLEMLERMGWRVEGIDFDPNAVASARAKGLTVHLGSLIDQHFPAESFDAVVMSHVIEHVPDAATLLKECHRILKPGGRLVMVTPNVGAFGHRIFGRHWRALEPPRHLYLHTVRSLERLTREAGFETLPLRTSARYCAQQLTASVMIRGGKRHASTTRGSWWERRIGVWLQWGEILLMAVIPGMGEELVCGATKGCSTVGEIPLADEGSPRRRTRHAA